jgi:hypothetical protein
MTMVRAEPRARAQVDGYEVAQGGVFHECDVLLHMRLVESTRVSERRPGMNETFAPRSRAARR